MDLEQQAQKAYEDALIKRYMEGLPLSKDDKKLARRIIKKRFTVIDPDKRPVED